MNKYAIYDEHGSWITDIHAESEDEALLEAKKFSRLAFTAKLILLGD